MPRNEQERDTVIKVISMMMLMIVTTLWANRFGTIQMQIGSVLRGMEDVIEGFLPNDAKGARQVRENISRALDEVAAAAGDTVPGGLRI